ncbi:hypothetical protein [Variovorax sp.]|uniref:hypothetical protein n=1 Tax=Variovorax sp. TaxID=1871043 RepID=UPI002D253396|nr:hypothetical protein [Variovorax sp.]HYP84100.1 hypothetical protein [Variovorax sp.]
MFTATSAIRHGTLAGPWQRRWSAFAREAVALIEALVSPGAIVAEMEQMHRLLVRAHAVESTDPRAAAELRRRASRIGRG